jgi:hypothetical protein
MAEVQSWPCSARSLPRIDEPSVQPYLTAAMPRLGPQNDHPVSQQFEHEYHNFYGWPYYGGGSYLWGSSPYLTGGITPRPSDESIAGDREQELINRRKEEAWDPCLRSTHAVTGYLVQATDGDIGHVEDFIIDEDNWSIRYLVVDTRSWWSGGHVLISPQWVEKVSWGAGALLVKLSRDAIQSAPPYNSETLNRDYEAKLNGHYNTRGYWETEPDAVAPSARARDRMDVVK